MKKIKILNSNSLKILAMILMLLEMIQIQQLWQFLLLVEIFLFHRRKTDEDRSQIKRN